MRVGGLDKVLKGVDVAGLTFLSRDRGTAAHIHVRNPAAARVMCAPAAASTVLLRPQFRSRASVFGEKGGGGVIRNLKNEQSSA